MKLVSQGVNGTKGEQGEIGQPGNVGQKGEPGLKGEQGPRENEYSKTSLIRHSTGNENNVGLRGCRIREVSSSNK